TPAVNRVRRRKQSGAVGVTVALLLLVLLGFMCIALDFGRLFIVKGELQTAIDGCALAAAQEHNAPATGIARARNAGREAGNRNRVNLQSATWSGQGQLTDADLTFRDAAFNLTAAPVDARYAECEHLQPAVRMWLLHILGSTSGDSNT